MSILKLKIITPKKIVHEEDVKSVTVPSSEGELTILPRHTHLFCLLQEGILTYRGDPTSSKTSSGQVENYLAIGGGYMETDGREIKILVSRAYGQDDIDEKLTQDAIVKAQKLLTETKDISQRREAAALMRKSLVDMKLIKRRKNRNI